VHARSKSDELRYWEGLLSERMDAALQQLYQLAPWLAPALEPELRVSMRDDTFHAADRGIEQGAGARRIAGSLRAHSRAVRERLASPGRSIQLRDVLEQLLEQLPAARAAALDLANRFKGIAAEAQRYFDDMDFSFLFDENRQLLRIGYNVDEGGRSILLRSAGVRSPDRGFPGDRQRRHPARDLAAAGTQAHRLSRSSDAAGLERHYV
jgi:hypothetical protein